MTAQPTPAQIEAAGLVEVTSWEEIDAAVKDGRGPLRKFLDEKFPPVTQGYVSAPGVAPSPPKTTFTAQQTGPNEITVEWSGFSPTMLSRNGTDTSNSGPWNTGTLTDQPTSGTFKFEYIVPGASYVLTAFGPNLTLTASLTMTTPTMPALGMNGGGLTWGGTTASNGAAFAQMQKLGAKYVRIALPWNYSSDPSWLGFYLADGSFDASILEKVQSTLTLAESFGLTPLFLVDGFISSSAFSTAAPANLTPGLPYSPSAYANAIEWLVTNVKGLHIEEVNEPDGYAQWNGTVPLLASDFAIAMQLVYEQAKKADPTCVIHMAPVSSTNGDAVTWRADLLKALPNFSDFIDIDGWHFYTWPDNEQPSALTGQIAAFTQAAGVTRPAWITEGGYQSLTTNSGNGLPEMTDALQAEYLPQLIELTAGVAEAFFIYSLADYGAGASAGYWGLVDSTYPDGDTNEKPSFAAIQNLFTKGS